MREYLLPQNGNFYKANLHAHTTVSDGRASAEEVKAAYRARGYSIVAFTDHDVMVDHSNLNDNGFLALKGYELQIDDRLNGTWAMTKSYHLNLLARSPEVCEQVFFNRRGRFIGNAGQYAAAVHTCGEGGESLNHSPACVNRVIRQARAAGFLTVYNHPLWSLHTEADTLPLTGLLGVEVISGCSANEGSGDATSMLYAAMLRTGNSTLLPIAADDNHNRDGFEGAASDSFIGFTMLKAPVLSYAAAIRALECGHCYASGGPEIHSLFVEDGRVRFTSSPVREILLCTAGRAGARLHHAGDAPITEGSFEIRREFGFFRLEFCDAAGRRAYTPAYDAARFC